MNRKDTAKTFMFAAVGLIALAGAAQLVAPDAKAQSAEPTELLRSLAEKGSAAAQYGLGMMYRNGEGVPQDYATAVKWFSLAAEQGYADAEFILGQLFSNGEGVPQDYATAVKWYHLAAEQGDTLAQNNLGVMYSLGQGVPQDYVIAHLWFNLAATLDTNSEMRANAARGRDRAAAQMTRDQVAEAQRLAREWKPK